MRTFVSVLAAYVAAGAFGIAFVNSMTVPSHSGTQTFVRVIR